MKSEEYATKQDIQDLKDIIQTTVQNTTRDLLEVIGDLMDMMNQRFDRLEVRFANLEATVKLHGTILVNHEQRLERIELAKTSR